MLWTQKPIKRSEGENATETVSIRQRRPDEERLQQQRADHDACQPARFFMGRRGDTVHAQWETGGTWCKCHVPHPKEKRGFQNSLGWRSGSGIEHGPFAQAAFPVFGRCWLGWTMIRTRAFTARTSRQVPFSALLAAGDVVLVPKRLRRREPDGAVIGAQQQCQNR